MLSIQQIIAACPTVTPIVPTSVTGLKRWFKSDAGRLQTSGGAAANADNDPVGEWQDQSGLGLHAGQATAGSRPLLKLAQKGIGPVLRFDGTDDWLATAADLTSFPSKRGTIFVVCKCTTNAIIRSIISTSPAATISWNFTQSSDALYKPVTWYDDVANVRIEADSTMSTAWDIHSLCRTSNTAIAYRRNGVDQTGRTITDNQPTASSILSIGADTAGANRFIGDISEILIYDGALSAGDIASLEYYLNQRWSVF